MRALALVCLLTSVHADNTVPDIPPGRLLANACRLLRVKTRANELLQKLGAVDVHDEKDGWSGTIPHSLFGRVHAFTPEIPQQLMFYAQYPLSNAELKAMAPGLKCFLDGPMRFGDQPYAVLMSLRRLGPH